MRGENCTSRKLPKQCEPQRRSSTPSKALAVIMLMQNACFARVAQAIRHLLGNREERIRASSSANSQLVRMAAPVGSRTLPLLCRKARRTSDNADVAAQIRSFLVIDLSKLGTPQMAALLTVCFQEFVPRVPQGMVGDLCFAFVQGEVEKGILPEGAIEDDNDDAKSQDTPPSNATVKVEIDVKLHYVTWHPYPLLSWQAFLPAQPALTSGRCLGRGRNSSSCILELMAIRRAFDRRRHKPGCSSGFMDMPTTLADWREFFRLWLFGPREPRQTTLQKWLRRPIRSGSDPALAQ